MTLTEFLLARIAEDEGMLWRFSEWSKARVLAECEAKRRIVEDCEEYAADHRTAPSDFARGRRHAALLAATRLAAVYADHPDYDQGWVA